MKFSKKSFPIKCVSILEYIASTLENIGIFFASFNSLASLPSEL